MKRAGSGLAVRQSNYTLSVAQVLPAERGLRRVIGDGDAVPDGEVEGLDDHDLLELYRSLVLLRTYDERSVVYHRQGRIATHVPHAAGLAWGKKLRGETAVAIAYFGDGATSEGAFHEGANFAAVTQAPLVLFCNNNYWAISTPLTAQTRAETLADKAVGYGMPGVRVDGADVLAVYEATREAVERARAGAGPTFVEAVTYRAAPHATADDPTAYIDVERVDEEKRNECVGRYERYLRRLGVLTDKLAEEIRGEAQELMRRGIAEAEAESPADTGLVFQHTFANPPPSFDEELQELRRVL